MAHKTPADHASIAIIGLGPRGMIVVERIIAQMRKRPHDQINLILFDPNPPGAGLHATSLPDYLMLNTVAGQLSFYPHPDAVAGDAPHQGPRLDEWCQTHGLRCSTRGGIAVEGAGRAVAPGDFLPRRVLGAYLEDCARTLLAQRPPNVHVQYVSERVLDVAQPAMGSPFQITTERGTSHLADNVFLSTGQGAAEQKLPLVRHTETICINGLGLTAMDMVAALTKGRGGIFAGDPSQPRYLKSGREPRIMLSSRSGLPFCARPDWSAEDASLRVPPVFFTRAAINARRVRQADGRLDFKQDILPLIALDMRTAFHVTQTRLLHGNAAANDVLHALQKARTRETAADLLQQIERQSGGFDAQRFLRTGIWDGDPAVYANDLSLFLQADLQECIKGLPRSPIKAALEVWRNQRDTIRHAVNGNGLTPASRYEFYTAFAPLSNRLVGGPQKERHAELLALIDVGVVTLLPPQHRIADHAAESRTTRATYQIPAHVGASGIARSDSPLLASLHAQGRIRRVASGRLDGIDITAEGHPVGAQGAIDTSMWIIGPAVEGATFYNHYVGTPDPACPLFVDAQAMVTRCLTRLFETSATRSRQNPSKAAAAAR